MAKKYIIHNNELIIGNVEHHIELVPDNNKKLTIGGGRWDFNNETKNFVFYDSSFEFGSVTKEQFKNALKNYKFTERMKDCKIYFTNHHSPKICDENLIIK